MMVKQTFTFLVIHQLLSMVTGNHLKTQVVCEDQHIDVTKQSGVQVEEIATSQIIIHHERFPARSFQEGDELSVEFRTLSTDGLIFHAESHNKNHELSAWVHNSEVRLRLRGDCHWLYLRGVAHDAYNVSDGRFHKLTVIVRAEGITFKVDGREERSFFTATASVFRCWHLTRFHLGSPSPAKSTVVNSNFPEYSVRMDGCLRNFHTKNGDQERMRTAYKRVSSCNEEL